MNRSTAVRGPKGALVPFTPRMYDALRMLRDGSDIEHEHIGRPTKQRLAKFGFADYLATRVPGKPFDWDGPMRILPAGKRALEAVSRRRARLDASGTAKPKTRLIGHAKAGDCIGPGTVADAIEDVATGQRTPLAAETSVVRASYNPGMNPFAPMPIVRFDGDAKLGDPGVAYEFNVRVRTDSCARECDWNREAQRALDRFADRARARWPWIGELYFSGRSGGWLAITDPAGKMTEKTLRAMARSVAASLQAFKKHVEKTYPRPY